MMEKCAVALDIELSEIYSRGTSNETVPALKA